MKTVHQAILHGEQILHAAGVDQPRWNAERLLLLAVKQQRSKIYADLKRELTASEWQSYCELLSRRAEHYPLAYLEGVQEFFGRDFLVNESVLIPRPETEGLIDQVLTLPMPEMARIVDLGSGSGNIPVTLAIEFPRASVFAVELSAAALQVLKINGGYVPGSGGGPLSPSKKRRIHIVCSDMYRPPFRPGSFHVVTCNPPYVEQASFSQLSAETRWEPKQALAAGHSLENTYRGLFSTAASLLASGGYLVFEIGFGQLERVLSVRPASFALLNVAKDRQDIPRIVTLQKMR